MVLKSFKNPSDGPILNKWVFDDFIVTDELFTKALGNLETCILGNNNSSGNVVSSLDLHITYDNRLKVASVHFVFLIKIY